MTPPSALDPMDLAGIDDLLTDEEKAIRGTVRAFLDKRVEPHVADWFERGEIDDVRGLTKELGSLGLLGMHLEGYGCAGMSAVDYGLACLELEATDSGVRSLVSVQGSLAMFAIHRWGSRGAEAGVAAADGGGRGDRLLRPDRTRPRVRPGVDAHPRAPRRRRLGAGRLEDVDHQRLIADVAVVWAQRRRRRTGIRGFVVPTDTPGFSAPEIKHKMSLRASVTSELVLEGVRLPADAVFPDVRGLKGPLAASRRRATASSGASLGAARDSLDTARRYSDRAQPVRPAARRLPARPSRSSPTWPSSSSRASSLALHLGRRKDAGTAAARAGQPRQAQQRPRGHRHLPDVANHPGRQRNQPRVPDHPAHEQPRVGAHLRGHRGDAHPRHRAGDDRSAGLPLGPRGRASPTPRRGPRNAVARTRPTRHTLDFRWRHRTV